MRHLEALADAGLTHVHLLPVFDIATVDEDRANHLEPAVRPRQLPARFGGAAGLHRAGPRPGRLQLGLRPVALHGARGQLRHRSAGRGPDHRVPLDGQVAQRRRAARRDGRRLQPHERGRPGREVGARSDRARLLPPPARGRHAGHLDLLREHRDRARHDGEAHGRLDRDLGARLQGRWLPLRPDGPPLEGQPARRPRRARRAHPRRRRRGRLEDLPVRRGLELRRGRQRRSLRPGHAAQHGRYRHRHVQRPAARRRPGWRSVRRRPAREPGLRERPLHRSRTA